MKRLFSWTTANSEIIIVNNTQCPRTDSNKRLSQHESLYPIGLKSARIEIPPLHRFFKN